MITTRRAAERFDQALAGTQVPDTETTAGRRTAALVDVATAVTALPAQRIAPSADFRTTLRERLDAEAAELTTRMPTQRSPTEATATVVRVGRKRQVLAGTVAALLVSGTAAAVVSTSALPGDVLYPVKRGIEDVRGAVGGDATQAATRLDLARERLNEAEQLVLRGEPGDVDAAELALRDFGAGAAGGTAALLAEYAEDGDAAHLAEVQDFVRDVAPQLERLRVESPESLHPLIDALLRQLGGVGGGLARTLAACGDPCRDAGVAGLDAATVATLERAGSQSSPAEPSTPSADASAAPAVPALPAAPGTPGTAAPAPAGAGVDGEGLVASLPALDDSPVGTTGGDSVPGAGVVDVPTAPAVTEPEVIGSGPITGQIDTGQIETMVEPPSDPLDEVPDVEVGDVVQPPTVEPADVPCVLSPLDDCTG